MPTISNERVAISDDAMTSVVGDETIILQLKTGVYFGLDAVGTRIWELLKEGCSPAAICDQMAAEYDVVRSVLENDVRRLLGELEAHQILAEPVGPID